MPNDIFWIQIYAGYNNQFGTILKSILVSY